MRIIIILLLLAASSQCNALIEYPDYREHPCKRPCDGVPMVCRYNFTLEYMFSMENNCMDCRKGNIEDCFNPQCVVASGNRKLLNVVNRLFPGPAIDVCLDDEVIVDVKNHLGDQSTSIHWHGIHQRNTQFMDGVPMITQCPIHPGMTFRYHFKASPSGTHFYHSHSGLQRSAGLQGAFIVRTPDVTNKLRDLYDFDFSEHILIISDWDPESDRYHYTERFRYKLWDFPVSTIVVNNFGSTPDNDLPSTIFSVEKDYRYRFRIIHSGSFPCPVTISIQNHQVSVISFDGNDVWPRIVDEFTISSGDRIDIILKANQPEDFYWIKFKSDMICEGVEGLGLLRYISPNVTNIPPKDTSKFEKKSKMGMNCINVPSNNQKCYTLLNMTSVNEIDPRLQETPDFKHYIEYEILEYNKLEFEDLINTTGLTPVLNGIASTFPNSNILETGLGNLPYCNIDNKTVCTDGRRICECFHFVDIPLNSVVEFILVSRGGVDAIHPLHIHGNAFVVIGHDQLSLNITLDEVKDLDKRGKLYRNFNDPPLKDTVTTPYGGYSIVRFFADNPGYWLLHCHLEYHMELGMAMVLKVGNPTPPPKGFPTCGDYLQENNL